MTPIGPAFLTAFALGCGAGSPLPMKASDSAFQVDLTATVAPGSSARLCRLAIVPRDLSIGRVESTSTAGTHHVEVALTDAPVAEVDGTPFDCEARRVPRRGTFYAAQETYQALSFGDGATLALRAGEVLVLEAHVLNATSSDRIAEVEVGLFAAGADGPALGELRLGSPFTNARKLVCHVPRHRFIQVLGGDASLEDVTLTLLGGALVAPIPLFESEPADPLVFRPALHVAAGERFELSCSGQLPCILTGTYFPADGQGIAVCEPAS